MLEFDSEALAKAVRAKRGERGFEEVAREIGLHYDFVALVEMGWPTPPPNELHAFCAWLGVPMKTFFVGGENEKQARKRICPFRPNSFPYEQPHEQIWFAGWDARGDWEEKRRVIAKPIEDDQEAPDA